MIAGLTILPIFLAASELTLLFSSPQRLPASNLKLFPRRKFIPNPINKTPKIKRSSFMRLSCYVKHGTTLDERKAQCRRFKRWRWWLPCWILITESAKSHYRIYPAKWNWVNFGATLTTQKRLHHKDLTLGEAPLIAQIGNTRFERATPTSRT